MVLPADQRGCGKSVAVEDKLLCVATAAIGAGVSSPWPIDAGTRAVAIITIIIAIIVRLFRPTRLTLVRVAR